MELTIEQYLQGQFDYEFSELNISVALACWQVPAGIPHSEATEKQKDLACSNLYIVLASIVSGGGEKTTKGNRSVSKRTVSFGITDRENFLKMAIALRAKWGIAGGVTAGDASSDGSESPITPPEVKPASLRRLFDRRG